MSKASSTASQRTFLARVLTALFGTTTKISGEIPKLPSFSHHEGNGDQGYYSRSSQRKRRKIERRVGHIKR